MQGERTQEAGDRTFRTVEEHIYWIGVHRGYREGRADAISQRLLLENVRCPCRKCGQEDEETETGRSSIASVRDGV